MRINKIVKRLFSALTLLLVCLCAGQTASAKWSKASTQFTYEGVEVSVTDRSQDVGKPYDTYGYTTFINHNNYKVRLKWRAYGVLKDGGTLSKVDEGVITIAPGKTHKEVYSYSNSKYNERNMRKYVVAIELEDSGIAKTEPSAFTQDGVSVEIVNRSSQMGRSHSNTYGYIKFENNNDYKVKVEWQSYGVMSNGKTVKTDSGTLILTKKATRQEVFAYGANGYSADDFKDYTVKVKVTNMEKDVEVTAKGVDASNESAIYKRVTSHSNSGSLTQQDFNDGIAWMHYIFESSLVKLAEEGKRAEASGDTKAFDRLYERNKSTFDRWSNMGEILDGSYNHGLMNAANKKAFEALKYRVESFAE